MLEHGMVGETSTSEGRQEVWSWGAGTSGQLGGGRFDDELCPKHVQRLDGESLQQLACGGNHVLALTVNGRVLVWGSQAGSELDTPTPQPLPQPLKALSGVKVVRLAAGWAHSAFITDDGSLLTCGEGRHGQLGLTTRISVAQPFPVGALSGTRTLDVACGMRHTLVVAEAANGTQVFAFGAGKRGQLGISLPRLVVESPVTIEGLSGAGVTAVHAAGDHSATISAEGDLCVWGRGYLDAPDMHVPTRIGRGTRWSHVALGWSHGLALTDTGRLFAWGSNRYGQLGTTGRFSSSPSTEPDQPVSFPRGLVSSPAVPTTSGYLTPGLKGPPDLSTNVPGETTPGLQSASYATRGAPGSSGLGLGDFLERQHATATELSTKVLGADVARSLNVPGESPPGQRTSVEHRGVPDLHVPAERLPGQWTPSDERGLPDSGVPGETIPVQWTPFDERGVPESGLPGETSPRGVPNGVPVIMHPIPFFADRKVSQIAAGAEHSAAVTELGGVFTWGWAEHGQLGLGDTDDRYTPQQLAVGIPSKKGWECASIYCGSGFTFAVLR